MDQDCERGRIVGHFVLLEVLPRQARIRRQGAIGGIQPTKVATCGRGNPIAKGSKV